MARAIDINCDLGEGFGPYAIGDDAAMMRVATSVNIACGFHAGDPGIMADTLALAKDQGVAVGAHPGFDDRQGFGRRPMALPPAEIERLVAYQIGALCGMAALAGHRVTHVKAHGALANMGMKDRAVAAAIARATRAVDPSLIALVTAGTELERAALDAGLPVAREIFADRAFAEDGTLVPRGAPGAVIHDAEEAAGRIGQMLSEGAIITQSGARLPVRIDSICVHGDTPASVDLATRLRARLADDGYAVAAFHTTLAA